MHTSPSHTRLLTSLMLLLSLWGLLIFPSHFKQWPPQTPPTARLTILKTPATPAAKAASRKLHQARSVRAATFPTDSSRQVAADERYDQPREAAEFYRLKRLPTGETELPVERYEAAREHMQQMPQYSTVEDRLLPSRAEMGKQAEPLAVLSAWTPLGPGNIGGRTRALLIHPTNPNVMYAAGVAGGVWKTTDGGASWTPLADLMANLSIGVLAMDPRNPNVIYAGTGEGYFNYDSLRGAGIFKTTDGGANWTRLASTGTEDFYYVNDLVISPTNSQRLYAATQTGVWRTIDGGANWTRVLNPLKLGSTSTVTGGCLDLAIRTDKAVDYVFASCGTIIDQATVYRNTDAGGSGVWTPVLSESGMGRTSLAIAPSDQSVVYAASASIADGDFQDGLYAVFRSASSGDAGTWTGQVRNANLTKLNTVLFSNPRAAFFTECGLDTQNFFLNQGWYDNVIAVDPVDTNRVWVGGIDLFRSDDGGMNWGLASYWWANGSIAPLAPQYAHADHHAIAFHPRYNGTTNQTVFVANDGGIFRTDNARAAAAVGVTGPCYPNNSAVAWTPLNNGYSVTQFYHGLPHPDGTSYFGGTQDNGTLRGTDAGGANGWREILGGDGGPVAIDPVNPQVLYASNPFRRIKKSLDGGATFNPAIDGISDDYALFINPLAMDPSDPQRLWTGGAYLWRTTNGAVSWDRASAYTPGRGIVSVITIAPTDANQVLVGMTTGEILRTDKGLTTDGYTNFDYAHPSYGFVSWVAFDPTNANVAYATYSTFGGSHVFRSADGGVNWTAIDGTGANKLPDIPVHCIVIDPANPARLYIGTDLGVFVSTDSGENWAVENTGFANVVTESLSLNVVNGATTLYAFTHGRGAWRVNTGTSGCNFALSTTGQSFEASGGTGSVNVTAAPSSCNWAASVNTSGASWITINSGSNGSGNGAVNFTVAGNTTAIPRTGTIAIAGKSFVVKQAGITCSYSLSSTGQSFAASGGTGSVNVTAGNQCGWYVTDNPNWITINSDSNGSGNGAINFTVTANPDAIPRVGELILLSKPAFTEVARFRVSQSGTASSCTYSISPSNQSFASSGGTGSVSITAGSGCNWQASSNASWITINSGSSGAGNGLVNFTVESNNNPNSRTGTVSIAGQTFTTMQVGRNCPATPISFGQAVHGSLDMSDCRSGVKGDGFYADRYLFNGTRGQLIAIAASAENFLLSSSGVGISPEINLFSPDGSRIFPTALYGSHYSLPVNGSYTVEVTSSHHICAFCGALNYALSLSVATPGCIYSIMPSSQYVASSGGTKSVNVTVSGGCTWQAISHTSWLTINSGGSSNGSGTVTFSVAAQTGTTPRDGVLTIAGQTATVTQIGDGRECTAMPISIGQTVYGDLKRNTCRSTVHTYDYGNGLAHRYSFTASAGQIVRISGYGSEVALIDPNGSVLSLYGGGLYTLPLSGTYIIEVYTSPTNDREVPYTLSLIAVTPSCTYSISPSNQHFTANGGLGIVNVTAASGCNWQVIGDGGGLTINSGRSGTGNGIVSYSVAPNDNTYPLTWSLTIAGQTFTVRQEAKASTCPREIRLGQTVEDQYVFYQTCSEYSFVATAGQVIAISINAGFSPIISLYSPTGSRIAVNYNFPGNSSIRIPADSSFLSLPLSGVYRIGIDYRGSRSSGPYTLTLSEVTPGCSYSVAPGDLSFGPSGGSGSMGVATGNRCAWHAFSSADWVTINSGNDNSGSSTITFNVAANTSNSPRYATLAIADQTFRVSQIGNGGNCTVTPITIGQEVKGNLSTSVCRSPTQGSLYYADRYSFSGSADQLVEITLSAFFPALYLIGPQGSVLASAGYLGSRIPAGSGFFRLPASGTYIIEVTSAVENETPDYTLSLHGATTSCNSSLASNSQSFSATRGTGSVGVTAQSECNWTAISNAPWITISSGGSDKGNGIVNYSLTSNLTPSIRTGTLTIAGQTFTVTQAGRPCTATPISAGQTLNGSLAASDCAPLALDSTAFYTDRYTFSGTAGQLVTILLTSSDFDPYLYLIGPDGSVLVEDDDGGAGLNSRIPAGSGSFILPATGNYTIEVTSFDDGQTGNYTLSLNAVTCAYALSSTSRSVGAGGASGSVTVTAPGGCDWTAASNASWLTLVAGNSGSGNGTVSYNVAASTSTSVRTGTVTIAGQTFTVTQDAANPVPTITTLNPSSASAGGAGLTLTVNGTNFIAGSVVRWKGSDRATTLVSSTQLTAQITAAEIAAPGTASVTVFNPAPGGGASNAVNLTINAAPDLALTKSHSGNFTAGTNGVYTLTVRNVGTATTTAAMTVTDILPTDLGFVSGSGTGWSCSASGQTVTCSNAGPLAVNASSNITLTVSVTGTAAPSVTNTASVATTGDANAANNTASDPTNVTCSFAVSPASRSFESAGGSSSVTVTAVGGCVWTASVNASGAGWITITAGASGAGNGSVIFSVAANTDFSPRTGTLTVAGQTVTVTQNAMMVSVSAASYNGAALASEMMAAAFGVNLATTTQMATIIPLPTVLAGTTVKVRDSAGITRNASLFFVSSNQVNYLVPAGTAVGTATVIITNASGNVSTGTVTIALVAPGLFTANSSGRGIVVGTAVHGKTDGTQTSEPLANPDGTARPIDLGPPGEVVALVLYGTGIRNRSSLSTVTATIGGLSAEVLYAGAQPDYVGLDQINVLVPRSLIGRGEVDIALTVDGKTANTVSINIK